jgi:hypothetical protein
MRIADAGKTDARKPDAGNTDADKSGASRAAADASGVTGNDVIGKPFIEISAPAGMEMFGSNPYAGANRFRFKGFPRCHTASGFSAPCRGSPLERRQISANRRAGSSGAETQQTQPPKPNNPLHSGKKAL